MDEFLYIIRKLANDKIDLEKDKTNLLNAPSLYNKICRLCLSDDNLHKVVSTFKDNMKYSDIIWTLLGMRITNESTYMICERCVTNLTLFYRYREKCNANNLAMLKLQKYVADLKDREPASVSPWCDYKYNPDGLENDVLYVEMIPFDEQIEIETETEVVGLTVTIRNLYNRIL
jgi:hypothetical protein